ENSMSGSEDNNPSSQWAEDPQASLQRQNERLQLLLNLTSRITSNLDLREVLRAISANFREVMRCDGAGIWLPGEELGKFKLRSENSMSGSEDNNPSSQWAEDPQASLQRQNERLQLLLNLTSRITSNLDLREVLRAISANFREVMRCDGAGIWLPGEELGKFKL